MKCESKNCGGFDAFGNCTLCDQCFQDLDKSGRGLNEWLEERNKQPEPKGEQQMKCAINACSEPLTKGHHALCQKHFEQWCKEGISLTPFITALNIQPTLKKNEGKPRMGLLRWGFLTAIAEALTFGATKYPEENYLNLPSDQLFESMLRHISELRQGRTHDEESGLHHVKHVAANCMMWFETLAKEGKL